MGKYKYILFDLDGTLTDSAKGIINGVRYALKHYNIPEGDYQDLYRFIGPPMQTSFETFYGFEPDKAKEAVSVYREYYGTKGLFENEVYEHMEDVLKQLKNNGKKLFVATSKPQRYAVDILEHFNLAQYFDYIGGATMDGKIGTKAQVIEHTLKEAHIDDLSEVVMVGDRHHDAEGAVETGIDCIGVLYGYGSEDELRKAGAKYIAHTVEEIIELV